MTPSLEKKSITEKTTQQNPAEANTLYNTGVAALHAFTYSLGRECGLSLVMATDTRTQPGFVNVKGVSC